MSKLGPLIFGVMAIVAAVALVACGGTNATVARKQTETQHLAALTSLQAQLEELALQPRPVPPVPSPETPSSGRDFQFCLIGSQSCMALDPRPFVVCPAAEDSVCDAQGSFTLLGAEKQPLTATPRQPVTKRQAGTERR